MSTKRMRFVGVTTGSSSIMTLFPVWAEILGLDAELVGLDLPLGASRQTYRDTMAELTGDPECVGALVTTHKISLFQAAADLFTELDAFAAECGEISSIAIRPGVVRGAAKDPITAGLSLQEVLADNYFAAGGESLCFGAGGAGTAIGWYLAQRADAPAVMTFVDTDPERLDHLRSVVEPHATRSEVRTLLAGSGEVGEVLAAAPPQSLVVNATGMGKDRPGSPLPESAVLPRESVIWELNYRGSLEFLAQARDQQERQNLIVVDGWRYFIHGWTQVMAEVFDLEMTPDVVAELAEAAERLR